jgi:hypothetical protein
LGVLIHTAWIPIRQRDHECFWVHCNTAYDGMIRTSGNQGITAGYGQLITLSGLGAA